MIKLRDYQLKAIDEISTMVEGERKLIHIPTGGGKTIVFAQCSVSSDKRILIVVPSEELREQAIEKIEMLDPDSDLGSVQASLDDVHNHIVIATRQSLTHPKSNRIERMLEYGEFEFVFLDESHQAPEQLEQILEKLNQNIKVVGFTATPFNSRMFSEKLFSKVDYSVGIVDLILNDYLCQPKAIVVESSTNLNNVLTVAGEFNTKSLDQAVNTKERNVLIVESYKKYASDRKKTLVFCTTIEHMKSVVQEFQDHGVYCKGLDSTNSKEYREQVLNEFANGDLPVLVNVAILTTGFDVPETDCIILARPTKSKILYTQIIGRGLRIADGKENCLIIDIADAYKKNDIMSSEIVFGTQMKNGETLKEAQQRVKREKEEEEEKARQAEIAKKEIERKNEELELKAKQIDLIDLSIERAIRNSKCDWYRIAANLIGISSGSNWHYVVKKENEEYFTYIVGTNFKGSHDEVFSKEMVNGFGGYHSHSTIEDAMSFIERMIKNKERNSYVLKEGSWKHDEATESQRRYAQGAKTKWDAHKHFASYNIKKVMEQFCHW